jgi:putative heme iron utilization protein
MSNEHGRPRASASSSGEAAVEPGGPLNVAAPSHADRARTLLESVSTGTLCTLSRDPAGYPYGSLVTYGLEANEPVFLISTLAEHTKNLLADSRASLLVSESRPGDPLANGRVTLLGRAEPLSGERRERARQAYLARFPSAADYATFRDFDFFGLEVSGVRYIGGYGRMSWVDLGEWRAAHPDPIAPDARAILEHMNQDHRDALPAYCRAFAGLATVDEAVMTSIDRLGFEMSVVAGASTRTVRLAFHEPIASKVDARQALVALLKEARAKLGAGPS